MNREVVVVESGRNRSKFNLLDAALEKVQFVNLLEIVRRKSQKSKTAFLIVIKPNLAMFFKEKVTVTDPELVEHLVDRLHDIGYTNVALGEAQNTFLKWLHNREIPNIARAIGYLFTTPKGRKYQVFDLARDGIPCDFPPEYSLAGIPISKVWQEADFRINFAKNKTHEEYLYTLCLKNLLGAIPLDDKHLHFHSRLKVWDVCLEMNEQFPVDFNIIDAYVSNHGNVGSQVLNAIETRTIIAGHNAILVDWVGAIKMGIDPYLSPLNSKALKLIGLPDNYQVIGSLTPYKGWRNVHPLISDSFLRLDEAEAITRVFWPASFIVNSQLFPWKKKFYKWVNAIISPYWARVDRNSFFLWLVIYMNYLFVWVFFMKRVWRTLINQKQLRRKELPINVSRNQFKEQDYKGLPAFMGPLEEIINAMPKRNGSCHTFVDGAILYYLERDVGFPFEEFVSKVDISKAVTYMKDYIGGRTVQVKFDSQGRCIHQLERTVFLVQPNTFVLFNGSNIDVTKIEWIEYGKGFQKIIWKTVSSDNNSAIYDDGMVTFGQLNGRTRIRIMVHQRFVNPPALSWIQYNYYPGLRRHVMVRGFRRFFEKTIDNYCSVAEGKYEAIGKPWIIDTDIS
jgi:uncharacterized protein (DUF362 family)